MGLGENRTTMILVYQRFSRRNLSKCMREKEMTLMIILMWRLNMDLKIILIHNNKVKKVFLNKSKYSTVRKINLRTSNTKKRLNKLLINSIWLSRKIKVKIKYKRNKSRPNIKSNFIRISSMPFRQRLMMSDNIFDLAKGKEAE